MTESMFVTALEQLNRDCAEIAVVLPPVVGIRIEKCEVVNRDDVRWLDYLGEIHIERPLYAGKITTVLPMRIGFPGAKEGPELTKAVENAMRTIGDQMAAEMHAQTLELRKETVKRAFENLNKAEPWRPEGEQS